MVLLRSVVSGQWSVAGRKRSSGLLTLLKPLFYLFILFTIHFSLFTSPAFAEEKVYKIKIDGMHCNMCVYRVTKSLKKLKEVREVEVDLNDGTATVLLNDGAELKPEALEEAVKNSGYNPVGTKELK